MTMRWARLKLWSISGRGQGAVSRSGRGQTRTLQREGYGLLELLKFFCKTQVALRRRRTHARHGVVIVCIWGSGPLLWINLMSKVNSSRGCGRLNGSASSAGPAGARCGVFSGAVKLRMTRPRGQAAHLYKTTTLHAPTISFPSS